MAHNRKLIEAVDPRGATGPTPRESFAEKRLRLERESKAQLDREAADRGEERTRATAPPQDQGPTLNPNMKIFRLPDGNWVTVGNSGQGLSFLRSQGYRGIWFPTDPGALQRFLASDGSIRVYRMVNEWFKGLSEKKEEDKEFDFEGFLAGLFPGGGGGFGSIGPVYQRIGCQPGFVALK